MTAFVLAAVITMSGVAELEARVSPAREQAITALKKRMNEQGTWEGTITGFLTDMDGGTTALVLLGLLEAGVPADDAALARAIAYVAKLDSKKVYVVSLQTQVLARINAKNHAKQIQANADWLWKNSIKKDDKLVGWSYPQNEIPDGSNTHFAVMALHAAAQSGAKIDAKVWEQIRDLYIRLQQKDGWRYYNADAALASSGMTTCGMLGLAIAAKHEKNPKEAEAAFVKGLPALFETGRQRSPKSETYHLFVQAELGRMLGVREFKSGEELWEWYRVGATQLIEKQKQQGHGLVAFGKQVDATTPIATAFALYFFGPPPAKRP